MGEAGWPCGQICSYPRHAHAHAHARNMQQNPPQSPGTHKAQGLTKPILCWPQSSRTPHDMFAWSRHSRSAGSFSPFPGVDLTLGWQAEGGQSLGGIGEFTCSQESKVGGAKYSS